VASEPAVLSERWTPRLARWFDGLVGACPREGGRFAGLLERHGLKDRVTRTTTALHVRMYRHSGGRFGSRPGAPSLLLSTTGRTSGRERTIAVFYLPDGDRRILVASYGGDDRHPQWYRNLLADPRATVQIGTEVLRVHARDADEAERSALWPRLVQAWPAYEDYRARTSRTIPVVVLEPA
jgi:deazaflavin-dependent oxidoreductase (nitroreductase family)